MSGNPTDDSEPLPASRIMPGPADLLHYPAHNLVAWQPQGVLDDQLLDEIGEWLCDIEKASAPLKRFVDFSRLASVAVRTNHVFAFARKRQKKRGAACGARNSGKQIERKTLGSGLNAGNIGAEIDVI